MIVKQEFKAGDIVHFIPMGNKEYVLEENGDELYPLRISECDEILTKYGCYLSEHIHPLLILIRRPEEKKKKKWYQVFYKYRNDEMPENASCLYNSEEDFYTSGISKDKLDWIELKFVCER